MKHDLPGVGKNLQDHYQASFAFRTNATDTLNEAVMSRYKSARLALEWLFAGSGQLAVGATEATMFCKSSPSETVADLQYQCLNFSSDSLKDGLHKWPGFTFIFSVCRPKSRGEITLRDAEGRTSPRILANYMTDPDDMRVMLAGYRIAQQIAATEPFRSLIVEQVRPNPAIKSDEEMPATSARPVRPSTIHAAPAGWARTTAPWSTATCAFGGSKDCGWRMRR